MRFVVIGPTYPFRGGIAQYTTLLTRHLRKAHEVRLISFTRQYPKWLYPGRTDRDPSPNPLVEPAEHLIDSLNPLTWLKTVRTIRQFKPDRVIMQWWVPFWTPHWAMISRMVNAPITFITHNALPHEPSRFDRLAVRVGMGAADHIIAQAQSDARTLADLFPRTPITVTPHPTYAELGSAAVEITRPDKPLLLFCGIVRPYKGLDILLDALPIVLEKMDVHLAIVGEMWDGGEAYREQIERLGENVTVEDAYVSNERLSGWIRAADLVVLPYRSATQSGIVQMAFGLGTPVLATRVGGLLDVIDDGVTGLLVDPESAAALASAIVRYFSDGLGNEMCVNIGRTRNQFSWERLCEIVVASPNLAKAKDEMV